MQTEKVIKRDNKDVLHTYARSQVVLAEGHGMTAADPEGKRYLDFTSGIGVNSLGYCHPAWVQAVCDQAATLQHTSNLYYTAPCGKLAKKLCRRTGMDAVLCLFIHLAGADLHLKGDALVADDGGVQALVAVGLGGGDIILEAVGQRVVHIVDEAQGAVTLSQRIQNDTDGIDICFFP